MKYLFYLVLWCAVSDGDILNCSESADVCDMYDNVECQQCVEYDYSTECGEVGVTSYD